RPPLIVQPHYLHPRPNDTIIAALTRTISQLHEPHQVLVHIDTPHGAASGLLKTSAVRCERLHTVPQTIIQKVIGSLSDELMNKVDESLKAALGIP
ncbi:MAG: type II toxin-antitoxin system PemK/MazF family toxin, partial [Gemmataceae bacterium]